MSVMTRVLDREVVVRNRFSTVVAIALVIMLAMSLAACGKKSETSADLKLGEGKTSPAKAEGTAVSGDSATASTGSTGTKATDPAGQEKPSTGTSTGTSGNSSTSGGTKTGTNTGTTGGTSASAKGITIKILWWNDTVDRAPKNAEVVFNNRSYRPATGKSDQGSIGPCPVGQPLKLIIYPSGRKGPKLVAEFKVDAQMVANSEQDAIHVEVQDTRVRVLGNPVNNFVQSFTRP